MLLAADDAGVVSASALVLLTVEGRVPKAASEDGSDGGKEPAKETAAAAPNDGMCLCDAARRALTSIAAFRGDVTVKELLAMWNEVAGEVPSRGEKEPVTCDEPYRDGGPSYGLAKVGSPSSEPPSSLPPRTMSWWK